MRHGSVRLARGLLAWAAWMLSSASAGGQEGWHDYAWRYRRAATVKKVRRTRLPGDEIAVVTMPTAGLTAAGAADVRVTTADGTVTPHRILMVGPGDRVRLAFALRPPTTKYFVYFGNPKPPKSVPELTIRRGVLLETWGYRPAALATLRHVKAAFARAGALIGRDFRDRIFLGHNPFGPQNQVCNLFTAHLVCPEAGEYQFATSSQDASFLLVDGQMVVANGGRHGPQRRAVRRGTIRLDKGPHELKVYHVNTGGNVVAMAAWKAPSGRRLWTIPPSAFAPVHRAVPGLIEQYGKAAHADFIPVHAGESFMANRYFQRYVFEVLTQGRLGAKATVRWDFGDGQQAAGTKCEHVYLADGPFKVTMTVKAGGQSITRANIIHVSRRWDLVTRNVLDAVADHARIVSGYDFARADPRHVGAAIALFERAGMGKALISAGDALLKRSKAPAGTLRDAVPAYAAALVKRGADPARAVSALLKGAEMTRRPDVRAMLTVRAGQIALDAGDEKRAESIFAMTIKKYSPLTTHRAIREARIGAGDVWRRRGNYAKALAGYRAARPLRTDKYAKQAVRKGDLARHVEDYLRRRMLADAADYLDRWEYEFPTERLEGYSSLLRARLAMSRRQYAAAAAEAEALVRVNPRSNYAAEHLQLAADAYTKARKPDQAAKTLKRIVDHYPESPLAAEAKKKLAGK